MIRRGDIWWADLPEPIGSEPGFRRPLLVVSADTFNASRLNTVVGVMLTSSLHLQSGPGNVLLERRETGLPRDSVANITQITTVDKSFLLERIGALRERALKRVEAGLRLVLEL